MSADSSVFQYSIYKRSDSKNWQVQFRDASGHLVQRGTGTSKKLKAYQVAADWQANGLPTLEPATSRPLADLFHAETIIDAIRKAPLTPGEAGKIVDLLRERGLVDVAAVAKGPGGVRLMDFLKEFWDYDNSPYIREKQAHGHRTSRSHCYNSTNRLKRWEEAFPDIELAKLTKADIRAFTLSLREAGLSTASVTKRPPAKAGGFDIRLKAVIFSAEANSKSCGCKPPQGFD